MNTSEAHQTIDALFEKLFHSAKIAESRAIRTLLQYKHNMKIFLTYLDEKSIRIHMKSIDADVI